MIEAYMTKTVHDSETPAHGQQVITACAFIHRKFDGVEKVFMPRRATTKKFMPDIYELPGGHIEFNENIVAGLKREIMEELGMRVKIGDPFAVFDYSNHIKGAHSVEIIYFATFEDPIENITTNPEDHSEFAWFAEDELHKIVGPSKPADDGENLAVKQGFKLLKGGKLDFAN